MQAKAISPSRRHPAIIAMFWIFGLLAALNCLFTGMPTRAAAGNPIKIGFIASLSGVAAVQSKEMVNGFRLYLDECHNQMGGRPVELIVESDDANPATGVQKFRKLVEQDKVDVVAGLQLSHVALAVAPLADKFKVPLIVSVAGADDISQRKYVYWALRTGGSVSQPVHPFGSWVYDKLHYRKIATVGVDFAYGWEAVGGFQKSFEQAGGQVVQKIWVPYGFTDYTSSLRQLRKDVDAVYIAASSQSAELLPKQYKQLGFKMPLLASGSVCDESIINHIGDAAIGMYSPFMYSCALETPANRRFTSQFRAKYGVDPGYYAECSYVSAKWIAKGVEALKGDLRNKDAFLNAMRKVELKDAPRGGIVKLDKYDNPIENIYIRKVEKKNGKLQNTVVDEFKDVSEFWLWHPEEYMKQPVYSAGYPPCKFCK